MRFFTKLTASKELRAALGLLDEASLKYEGSAFPIIRKNIEDVILKQPDELARIFQDGTSPRQWCYAAIANVAGDILETGRYHVYRGVLNPLGPGPEMLSIYDKAIDELVQIGATTTDNAEKEKMAIRANLKSVG